MPRISIVSDNKSFTIAPCVRPVKKSQMSYNPMSGISKGRFVDVKNLNNCSQNYGCIVKAIIEISNFFKSKLGSFFTQFYSNQNFNI